MNEPKAMPEEKFEGIKVDTLADVPGGIIVGWPDAPAVQMAEPEYPAGYDMQTKMMNGIPLDQWVRDNWPAKTETERNMLMDNGYIPDQHTANLQEVWMKERQARKAQCLGVQMATSSRFVNLPRDKAYEALKDAVGKHLGQPLPEGTVVTGIAPSYDGYLVNIDNPEFGELPPDTSHELKPRKR